MRLLKIIPHDTAIPFIKYHKIFVLISAICIAITIALGFGKGFNFGIDFLGGIMLEIETKNNPSDIASLRSKTSNLGLGEISIQQFGDENIVLIRVQRQPHVIEGDDSKAQQEAVKKIRAVLDDDVVEYRRIETVGPVIGDELLESALYAIATSILLILIYIWFRFEWQFGICAILALAHDIILTVGLYALTGLEFNLTSVAALLTVAGYSINDTVVIFDRVRENIRRYRVMPLDELFNLSINQTLSRTILTAVTTLLALLALVIFGGQVIFGFSIAMVFGVVIGTYSSISIAVALLLYLQPHRGNDEDDADNNKKQKKEEFVTEGYG